MLAWITCLYFLSSVFVCKSENDYHAFLWCVCYFCQCGLHRIWEMKNEHRVLLEKPEEKYYLEGKAVPLQAWSGPECSRKLRFPVFMTTAQDGGKVVSPTHRPPLPQEMLLVLISSRGWIDPRAIVRSEGFYVNEKFQWHQLGSNQRPSDLYHSTLTTVPPRFHR